MPLPAEAEFYGQYSWCLNALPTIREVVEHLHEELDKLTRLPECWQQSEVITNTFLLACTLTDTIDDHLAGARYDFSKVRRALPPARPAVRIIEGLVGAARGCRTLALLRLQMWRGKWADAVTEFLAESFVVRPERWTLLHQRDRLIKLLGVRLPARLLKCRPRIPAFFRSRDFTPWDCLELGRQFLASSPDSKRPVTVMGLRTAGSFLAPLLCAFFGDRFQDSQWVAVRPKHGLDGHERAKLRKAARQKAQVLIIDESIHSGQTLVQAVDLLRQSGFADHDIVVLNPAEPAFPHWRDSAAIQCLPKVTFISLNPPQRYKQRVLEAETKVEPQLNEYFTARGYARASIVPSEQAERLNREWREPPSRVDVRLKRLYEVHLDRSTGPAEVRYVLAKSVGWGWLGYHAFIAGQQLAAFVPTILGLREGILYTEWIPQHQQSGLGTYDREQLVAGLASYCAARSERLRLNSDPARDLAGEGRLKGLSALASSLGGAYNSRIVAAAERNRIRRRLSRLGCQTPILTDSKMSREEWLLAGSRLLKVDFEHHCQGKNDLGVTDPVFDLAGAIHHFGLSEDESGRLVRAYSHASGDASVAERLMFHKILVGLWSQNLATLDLKNRRLLDQHNEHHRQYVAAWNFLVIETLRECGKLCRAPAEVCWRSPFVGMDIDGVLDRMVFGFPSTTAAGIKAVSLLHAHGFPIVANTARSLREVKEYCRAYHFAGGVAEYGAVIWDAVSDQELVLISEEARQQLAEVAESLRQIPGVFLNEDYQHSLRAFTYQNDRTTPLPPLIVQDVLASRNADGLQAHHTGLDTAILARETNKGSGLLALADLVGLMKPDFLAIGDSEPDLAMFRVASQSFAPGNVACAREARSLGARIAHAPYQPGLLEIARWIVHPESGACDRCRAVDAFWPRDKPLFVSLLEGADKRSLPWTIRSAFSPSFWAAFRQ
jgi:hydroxymethylpyrimidine pyrophosphatase-like HAD family hydrolase